MRDVRLDQARQDDWADAASWPWDDPSQLLDHLTTSTNIIRAAQEFDWTGLIGAEATVLDLGCGSGWLTALLSARPEVQRVVAWDGSERMLSEVLPAMVGLLDGEIKKVEPVCGRFVPLLVEDGGIDLVVMSSAFHHCDDPDELLEEIRRVLSPDGALVLLNETPWHPVAMLGFTARLAATAVAGVLGSRRRHPGALHDDHVLYDPRLGDRAWTIRGWHRLAGRAGWSISVRSSGLYSYPASTRRAARLESPLTHFVLRPSR